MTATISIGKIAEQFSEADWEYPAAYLKRSPTRIMLRLAQALPDLADDLSQGIASMGYEKLAASVYTIEVAERCKCDEPGCVTFYCVPKLSAPSPDSCKRIVAPARGVTCVQYVDQQITWIEVLGRPEDREKLDKYESRIAGIKSANKALDTEPRIGRL